MFKSINRLSVAATAILVFGAPRAAFVTDAAVGAASIVVLLSVGTGATSMQRHPRVHRRVAG